MEYVINQNKIQKINIDREIQLSKKTVQNITTSQLDLITIVEIIKNDHFSSAV